MSDTREIVQKFIDHIEAHRFVEAFSMVNEDGKYTVTGKTAVSGTYEGRVDVFNRLLPALAGFTSGPDIRFSHVFIDGDEAMVRATGSAQGVTGPYDQPYYAWYFRVAGDGLAEAIEYLDTVQMETALFGKKLVDA
jgi:ketosteroid isomerase-like protein